jgi:hypothetical protein
MSLLTKILAGLNIIVAGVLVFLAGRCYYARHEWTKHLEMLVRVRDGTAATDELLDRLKGMKPTEHERLMERVASDYARRKKAGDLMFLDRDKAAGKDDEKPDQMDRIEAANAAAALELLKDEVKNNQFAQELGLDNYRRLIAEYAKLQQPKLRAQEQRLAAEKSRLLTIRRNFQRDVAELNAKINVLKERIEAEKALTTAATTENLERQKELAQLYTEVEEWWAARNLAQGRERDIKDLLARTKARFEELTKLNQTLAAEIRKLEGVATAEGGE